MGTAKTRYYEVRVTLPKIQDSEGVVQKEKLYLVDAPSTSAAEKHVAKKFMAPAEIASAKRVAELMGKGVKPEVAGEQ